MKYMAVNSKTRYRDSSSDLTLRTVLSQLVQAEAQYQPLKDSIVVRPFDSALVRKASIALIPSSSVAKC